MGWQELLSENSTVILPWLGGHRVSRQGQTWRIQGPLPLEYGWYQFELSGGRRAKVLSVSEPDFNFEQGQKTIQGYLMGNRLIPDGVSVDPDPNKLIDQTLSVFLVEPGLERFARAIVCRLDTETEQRYLYLRQVFPTGPETEVEIAYQDHKPSLDHIRGVTPALDFAFKWLCLQRMLAEVRERNEANRRAEEEHKRKQEALLQENLRKVYGNERRALATVNFNEAARQALAISGAELLDARPSRMPGEMIVQYRLRHRRLECIVNSTTLRVIDSGICLTNNGIKGDTFFTLESLPSVVIEAIDTQQLVVYRHVLGDQEPNEDLDDEW